MKITIEPTAESGRNPANQTHNTVSVSSPYDDLNIDDVAAMLRATLIAWGFHPETVDELLGAE